MPTSAEVADHADQFIELATGFFGWRYLLDSGETLSSDDKEKVRRVFEKLDDPKAGPLSADELRIMGEVGYIDGQTHEAREAVMIDGRQLAGELTAAGADALPVLRLLTELDGTTFDPVAAYQTWREVRPLIVLQELRLRASAGPDAQARPMPIYNPITAQPEILEPAILELLPRIPETWQTYAPDSLTATQSQALWLLTAAGLVERRGRFRLRMMNHPVAVEAVWTGTGETGAREPFTRVADAMQDDWANAWAEWLQSGERCSSPFHCEQLGPEEWRLTDYGVLSRQDAATGRQKLVLDLIFRRSWFDGRPHKLPDGRIVQQAGGVPGSGALVSMKKVNVDAAVTGTVNVGNWQEGGEAFATAFAGILDGIQAKTSVVGAAGTREGAGDQGKWQPIAEIEDQLKRLAPTDSSILFLGETGTGKEFYAKKVHDASARKDKPFVAVNCATLPKERIDSELFGHKRGSFTGAIQDSPGRIRQAAGGMVFLDEIGDLPDDCWGNLLRFLQGKEIQPVGGGTPTVDVRILAATNQPERIRQDAMHRFDHVLHLPPLRARREDISALAKQFFDSANVGADRRSLRFPQAERNKLAQADYDWPGNIRQLEKAVQRAALLHDSGRDLTAQEVLDAAKVI